MIQEMIEQLFHTKQYTLEKMDKGLTNHNYLLRIKQDQYVVRIPRQDSAHIINRKHEAIVNKLVTDLDVKMCYFNTQSGIKITRYIEAMTYQQCHYPDKIERCALMMKTLHKIPAVSFSFSPFSTLDTYRTYVKNPLYDLRAYESFVQEAQQFQNKEVLCHNDWVDGNILFTPEQTYLIDYEYAASNDPLFDVTSFLSENQIFDKTLRERFFKAYFGTLEENTKHQLYTWEMFHNILWCNWAMMMYESRQEEVYRQIAEEKYKALHFTKTLYE